MIGTKVIRAVIVLGLVSMAWWPSLAAHSNRRASEAAQTAWAGLPGHTGQQPPATAFRPASDPAEPAASPRASRSRVPEPPASRSRAGYTIEILKRIAWCESKNRYDARNPHSTASGKYQVLDSSWDGYGGYTRAYLAPPAVQEKWAREAFDLVGVRPWEESRWCWG